MRRSSLHLAILSLALAMPQGALADVVVLTSSNMASNGWAFGTTDVNGDPDPTAGTAGIVSGPGTPPGGTGYSANLATNSGRGDGSSVVGTNSLDGLPLSALTSLSYSTYMTTNDPNNQQFPYIAVSFSTTGSGPADDNVIFEPPYQTATSGNPGLVDQGATNLNQWQTWNAIVLDHPNVGGWWDGNGIAGTPGTGVMSFADVLSAYPNAVIADYNSTLLGLEFQVGFGGPDDNFNGNVDNINIGYFNGDDNVNTTYVFGPSAAVPEAASLAIWSVLGLVIGGGYQWRRGRQIAAAA